MPSEKLYDVIVVGGGPVGWATAYEVAKSNHSVLVLEQNNFFNQAGSSGDLMRMFRTMYTEPFMAKLAKDALDIWDELERDAGTSLRSMTGLLNFGDKDLGHGTPEGTLFGPIPNLVDLKMPYKKLTVEQIEARWPFQNLPKEWEGLYAPDNGVINVPLLLRTLSRLAKDYGADAKQHTEVTRLEPFEHDGKSGWRVCGVKHGEEVEFTGSKVAITSGAYTNHVLKPSFDFSLDLSIWEMVATYFSANAGPGGTTFPSMWFLFAPDKKDSTGQQRSQLFYGFPTAEWGPPNQVRIAVDAATRTIRDPDERQASIISPEDIRDTQEFVQKHVIGVDATVPASSLTCLQTNVADNMFVLDYVPEEYLRGGVKDSVAVFTAGWAMKFVPLLGRALKQLLLDGRSPKYALPEFSMTRKGIIASSTDMLAQSTENGISGQAKGSSLCLSKNT